MTRLCRWERCQRRHVEHSPWCLEHRDELLHRMYASSPHEAGGRNDGAVKAVGTATNTAPSVSRGTSPALAGGPSTRGLSRPFAADGSVTPPTGSSVRT